ncbi:MAG: ATP-grasp domain-containing protein [bacterium]
MKIAIHHRVHSFSENWIRYCQEHAIDYKVVNCYDSNAVSQIADCDAVMWHFHHNHPADTLFAKQFLFSLQQTGKKVFPDFNTVWHFDDKLGQKYLLELSGVPVVPTHVFFSKQEALQWSNHASFPKVFKLRGGAGAENVMLVKDVQKARKLIKKAFAKGFRSKNRISFLKERIWHFKRDQSIQSFINISKGIGRLFIPGGAEKALAKQKNYVYFQDYIPGNDADIRVIVIEHRAFAIKRMVRKGDFRASGSGQIVYDPAAIPVECLRIAFDATKKMNVQCMAYDFVLKDNKPLIVEISYAFTQAVYKNCPGYWTDKLDWVEGHFTPEFFMIQDLIKSSDG